MYASVPPGRSGQNADWSIKPFGCPPNRGESASWSIKPFGCNTGQSAAWSIKPFGASTGAFQGNHLGDSRGSFQPAMRNTSKGRPVYDFTSSSATYSIKPFGQRFSGNVERIASVGAQQVQPIVDAGLTLGGGAIGGAFGGPPGALAGSAIGTGIGIGLNVLGVFGSGVPSGIREQAANNSPASLQNAQPIVNLASQVQNQIGSMQATVAGLKAAGQSTTASLYQMAINGLELIDQLFTIFSYGSSSLPGYNPEAPLGNGSDVVSQMQVLLPHLINALTSSGAPASLIATLKAIPSVNFSTGPKAAAVARVQAWLNNLGTVVGSLQSQLAALPVTPGTITGSTTTTSTIPTTTGGTTTSSVTAPNVTATQNSGTGVVTVTDHVTGQTFQFGNESIYQMALNYAAQSGTSIDASPYLLVPAGNGTVTVSVNPTTGQVTTTNSTTGQTRVYPSVASYNDAANTSSIYGGLASASSQYHPLPITSTGQTTGSGYYVSNSGAGYGVPTGSGYSGSSYSGYNRPGGGYAPAPIPIAAPVSNTNNYLILGAVGLGAWFFFFHHGSSGGSVRHRSRHRERYEMIPEPA